MKQIIIIALLLTFAIAQTDKIAEKKAELEMRKAQLIAWNNQIILEVQNINYTLNVFESMEDTVAVENE